jgi:AAA+ ATPase superfamily predicted ATPase
MFPDQSFAERLAYWSTLGGTPLYLLKLEPRRSYFENVRRLLLSPGEILFEEAEWILRQELKEPRTYFAILRAIALGKRKLSEIVNETGLPPNVVSKYLAVLRELRLARKEVPATELQPEKSKRGLYGITDHYFRFWFRWVFPNRSLLEEGQARLVLQKIRGGLSQWLSAAYEDLLPDILRSAAGKLPRDWRFPHAGRWWSRTDEIDLVALDPEARTILFGEAKWTRKPVGTNVLEALAAKAERVDWHRGERRERFALFSRAGFTPDLMRLAKERAVLLFHGENLVSGD